MGKKKRNMGFTANQWRVAEQLGLTTEKMQEIDKNYELKGYPKSMEFAHGYIHLREHRIDKAIAAFIIGAKNDGCVACIYFFADHQKQRGNMHLALPIYLEAALRGHTRSMHEMVVCCYNEARPQLAVAFGNFWIKIMIELGDNTYTNEERMAYKKMDQSRCANCGEEGDYEDITSKKWCGGCRYYSYCGKDCQTYHWSKETGNHMGECRQLKILKHYFRHYVVEIREAIIQGVDPRTLDRLQMLRTKLGLNRPKEEYEELLSLLSNDDKNDISQSPNRYEYLTARTDGTVWIGSTPNTV